MYLDQNFTQRIGSVKVKSKGEVTEYTVALYIVQTRPESGR